MIKSSWDWFYFKSHRSWLTKRYGLIFRLESHTYYFILLHTKSTGNKWKLDYLEGSICESHAKNRTQIGHFSWILGPSQNLMKNEIFERLWESMRGVVSVECVWITNGCENFVKFHQKNAPKSMKNVRLGSGFLHVILKLIPQQDPIGKHSYLTHRAKFWALLKQRIRPYLRVGHGVT